MYKVERSSLLICSENMEGGGGPLSLIISFLPCSTSIHPNKSYVPNKTKLSELKHPTFKKLKKN